jgi:hypothetical protein
MKRSRLNRVSSQPDQINLGAAKGEEPARLPHALTPALGVARTRLRKATGDREIWLNGINHRATLRCIGEHSSFESRPRRCELPPACL